ncbi:sulfur oxidation c-type cytochrome SoxX [Sulfurivermis fontis]|uniref:sulfur oxidation c-type cytochrome SoxX n=1 Tax=Sulfurivermis fontis TaxID=1972068 RepID=UPI000FD6CC64|nr:sulfur oxidation c-type cytochrome SoxX [Sulfurivermis fontis]
MRKPAKLITAASAVAAMLGALTVSAPVLAADAAVIAEGKKIVEDRRLGNCLACHMIEGADMPGTIGPPLVAMKARFPDKAKLRAQIWDATKANANSMMPPFGKHRILTEDQIDKVVEYIYTL